MDKNFVKGIVFTVCLLCQIAVRLGYVLISHDEVYEHKGTLITVNMIIDIFTLYVLIVACMDA